jgi:sodium-dependent dicarboxylate transporter 2/3/5
MAQAATSGAMLFLISTPPNVAAKSFIERAVPGIQITFVDWFIVGAPHAIAGLLVSWTVTFLVMKPGFKKLPASARRLETQSQGPMSSGGKLSLFLLA